MTDTPTAFSSDGSDAINRKIIVESFVADDTDVDQFYEIHRCAEWIRKEGFAKIALQFPDGMLKHSADVTRRLTSATDAKFYILADTSYGSCCVDEVAAQHVLATAIVHFGHACLSPTSRLPVLYVFGQKAINVKECAQKFSVMLPDSSSRVILVYDFGYFHAIASLAEILEKDYPNLVVSKLATNKNHDNSVNTKRGMDEKGDNSASDIDACTTKFICGRTVKCVNSIEDYNIFYIGGEGSTLNNLIMTHNKCTCLSYNPENMEARKETVNVNRALMRRYYMVEKAKDARIVGIVVGTLGVSNYLDVVNRLRKLIMAAGKKTYMFMVGKLNISKLANFMEIDVFVLVSCPETTLIDSTEFYRPVVTPFEMELACNSKREWTGEYVTNFQELLPGGNAFFEIPDSMSSECDTDVSLITGEIRRIGVDSNPSEISTAVVARDQILTVDIPAETAGEFLGKRTWSGLNRDLGETSVTKAVEGKQGIAAEYTDEMQNKS